VEPEEQPKPEEAQHDFACVTEVGISPFTACLRQRRTPRVGCHSVLVRLLLRAEIVQRHIAQGKRDVEVLGVLAQDIDLPPRLDDV
jgi:hypothetical protein